MHRKLVCLMLFVLCRSLFADDAGMFRGNPRHTGVYEAVGPAKFNGLKWKFHTGGMVVGSPTVVAGAVYVGSTDGNLYAIDAQSGSQKWKFETKSRIPSTPAIARGIVYFGAYDGNFYAVDAGSGALKFTIPTRSAAIARQCRRPFMSGSLGGREAGCPQRILPS